MLGDMEVKEIVAGVSSPEEILEIRKWMEDQHAKDQSIIPTSVVSMDVEELRVNHYDWMKMTGELPMTTWSEQLKNYLAEELWISKVSGATGLLHAQMIPCGYLKLNPRFNSALTISKRCKSIGRPQRDFILEWARLNPGEYFILPRLIIC